MKKIISVSALIAIISVCNAQMFQLLDTVKAPSGYENIYIRKLFSDSLASSFVLYIKKEVKAHKHVTHSEHVYVLEGEGEMMIGDTKKLVGKGDMIFIPKGAVHALKVTSSTPLKIISVQSPMFDGKDRVMME